MSDPLDILAIAAHRDDVEQTCGGTLLKAAQRGQRTGILDLTRGEMGTRGSAEDREREANDAGKILGAVWRQALDIPDGRVENTWENRLKVATAIRETRPRVIILPYWYVTILRDQASRLFTWLYSDDESLRATGRGWQ